MFKIPSIVLLLCLLRPCTSLFSKEDPYNEADTPCSLILSIGYPSPFSAPHFQIASFFLFFDFLKKYIFLLTSLVDFRLTNSKSDLDEVWNKGSG